MLVEYSFQNSAVLLGADLLDHVEDLADELLLDDLEELVLLEVLAGDVQRQIVRVHDSVHEAQVLGHHVLEVVGDEDATDEELDVLHLLAVVGEHVVGALLGHVEE